MYYSGAWVFRMPG